MEPTDASPRPTSASSEAPTLSETRQPEPGTAASEPQAEEGSVPRRPRLPRSRLWAALRWTTLALLLTLLATAVYAATLDEELGRSEVRILSAPYEIPAGRTVREIGLPERLERLGYERVRGRRPERPGQYFWGNEVFWIYRPAHRLHGRERPDELVGLRLKSASRILGAAAPDGGEAPDEMPYLEPEILAESLSGDRARRRPVRLENLPEHVWRPLLAIEDARFFDHSGVDGRSVARALLANLKAGGVAQGGSTITQQLIKMRDLTPKRSLGRKVSEAFRALALEADHSKEEILQSYLNHVYYGHVDGMAVHSIGTAARVFFDKRAEELTLAEAAVLAGVIQSPNRLSPVRHPERARQRRDVVLSRMEELGWATAEETARAKAAPLGVDRTRPQGREATHFVEWAADKAREEAGRRIERGLGVVVETGLDPYLQAVAEEAVGDHLARLRRRYSSLRSKPLSAALVAIDARTGAVVAHVGGDPRGSTRGGFDRVRQARRQPGSTVKPLVMLEAFDDCGGEEPLHPATLVADEPLTLDLPSGAWSPGNSDDAFHGDGDLRRALTFSYNTPFVRLARHCGFGAVADTFRRAGLPLPKDAPPSFTLGAVEATPLELARAYTVFATPGRVLEPRPVLRIERPGGRVIDRDREDRDRVSRASAAWLVRDVLLGAVREGTASSAALPGLAVAAKTGTSSERRDAWLAGLAGSLVTVAWVGLDDGRPLGLAGSQAAAPMWRDFMAQAVPARPAYEPERPRDIVEKHIHTRTGLLVRGWNSSSRLEYFRRGAIPRRDRFYRSDEAVPVIR